MFPPLAKEIRRAATRKHTVPALAIVSCGQNGSYAETRITARQTI
jgi:hypothetical protein